MRGTHADGEKAGYRGRCAPRFQVALSSATVCQMNVIRTGALAAARVQEILRPRGLTGPTFHVLMILHQAGEPLSPSVLSQEMAVPANTMTHTLDVLERDELVRRTGHPHHRHMLLIELTEYGRATVDELLPRLQAMESERWASFSEEERQTLLALLTRAQAALEECAAKAG